jgi:hypothetical protein
VAVAGSSPRADTLLASRAEARRAVHRLDQFGHAEIDFSGIGQLGHGFADEMFRVFSRQHPAVELMPVGMSSQVAAMIDSVRTQQAVQR